MGNFPRHKSLCVYEDLTKEQSLALDITIEDIPVTPPTKATSRRKGKTAEK